VWLALAIENRGVKDNTTWLLTNILVYIVTAAFLNVKIVQVSVRDNFAYRLQRELVDMVAKLAELAIS
jgi:hypothetical protein